MRRDLSAEELLIIRCAIDFGDGGQRADIERLISRVKDWRSFLRLLWHHRLTPTLHFLLRERARTVVPEAALNELRAKYRDTIANNAEAQRQLVKILREFRFKGVQCIILKGLHIATMLYRDISLRPMDDIDILVHSDDLFVVHAILEQLGYSVTHGGTPGSVFQLIHYHASYVGIRSKSSIEVELHWDLQDRFNVQRIDTDQLWTRAVPWKCGGESCLALIPEDLLAYMCYHADRHGRYSNFIVDYDDCDPSMVLDCASPVRIAWYSEILRLMQLCETRLDWAAFVENCRGWGLEAAVYSSLSWISKIFNAPLGTYVVSLLNPPTSRKLLGPLFSRVMKDRIEKHPLRMTVFNKLCRFAFDFSHTLQFRPIRMLDLLDYIFPPAESVAARYGPTPHIVFNYVRHVVRALSHCTMFAALMILPLVRNLASRPLRESSQLLRRGRPSHN